MNPGSPAEPALSRLSFLIRDEGAGIPSVTPCVDGRPLSALVAAFERDRCYDDPAGGYGGLIPSYFNYGPAEAYFLGDLKFFAGAGKEDRICLLACECGEVGCWPLEVRVEKEADRIRWVGFGQPFRPGRDYSGFGPFLFDRGQYEEAVLRLAAEGGWCGD
jgi:hypothetical protein